MLDYIKKVHNYILCLESICREKNYNQETYLNLKDWLCKLAYFYNSEQNIIEYTSLEDYLESYLQNIKNVNFIKIYQLEEVLKDKSNYFYSTIKKIPGYLKGSKITYRLRKIDDEYIIDPNGEYYISAIGACWCLENRIELINNNELTESIHHELTHIDQDILGFSYPSFLPYSANFIRMLREGDATFHEKLSKGNISSYIHKWNFIEIENNTYEYYYQMYMMLMLSLPKEMIKNWRNGQFNVASINNNQAISLIFAIITMLLKEVNSKIDETTLANSINKSYHYCTDKLNVDSQVENKELITDHNSVLAFLNNIKNNDKSLYQFGQTLSLNMQKIVKEKLSSSELFKLLIESVQQILIQKNDLNGLVFLESIKDNNKNRSI